MRVLVTGAGGFIGARLAFDLAKAGYDVVGTWHMTPAKASAGSLPNLGHSRIDLADLDAVDRLFVEAGPFDAIVHAAAVVAAPNEEGDYLQKIVRANVQGHANLVSAAARFGCSRFQFMSSISVYGRRGAPAHGYAEADPAPNSYYGWSKRAGETLLDAVVTQHDIQAISFRLAGVHGEGRESGAFARVARAAAAGDTIFLSNGRSRFRWAFIQDVSQAVLRSLQLDHPVGHEIVNVASADVFNLEEVAAEIKLRLGSNSPVEIDTNALPVNEVMNIDKARGLLGLVPMGLSDVVTSYLGGLDRG